MQKGYSSGIFTNGHAVASPEKRDLVVDTSITNTLVEFTFFPYISAFEKTNIKVIAKDTAGDFRNVGGDLFFVKVENQCTRSNGWQ